MLVEELVYASSVEQSAESIQTARYHIHNNPNFTGIAADLEGLLYHWLEKEWNERHSLTMMLEQIQLAALLGKI